MVLALVKVPGQRQLLPSVTGGETEAHGVQGLAGLLPGDLAVLSRAVLRRTAQVSSVQHESDLSSLLTTCKTEGLSLFCGAGNTVWLREACWDPPRLFHPGPRAGEARCCVLSSLAFNISGYGMVCHRNPFSPRLCVSVGCGVFMSDSSVCLCGFCG